MVWFAADSQTAGIKMPSPLYIVLARRNFAQVFIVQCTQENARLLQSATPEGIMLEISICYCFYSLSKRDCSLIG